MTQSERKKNPNITISAYKNGNESEIVSLLNQVFGGWPTHKILGTSEEYWKWKYLDSPVKLLNIAIATTDGKIIACDHGLFKNVKLFDKTHVSEIGCDTAVHPEYRKLGIYNKMSEFREKKSRTDGTNFGYWITINPIFIEWAKKGNRPSLPFKLERLLWINDISRYLFENDVSYSQIKKTLFTIRKKILNINNDFEKYSDDYSIKDITRFKEDAEVFWNKLKPNYDLIVERNSEYLNHRYCDTKTSCYIVKAIYRKNELLGYTVVATRENKKRINAHIIDFITLPAEHIAANILLQDTLNYLVKININSVDLWVVKNSYFSKLFKKNTFIQTKSLGPHIFLQEETINMEEWGLLQQLNPDRTHFVMGDTDIC